MSDQFVSINVEPTVFQVEARQLLILIHEAFTFGADTKAPADFVVRFRKPHHENAGYLAVPPGAIPLVFRLQDCVAILEFAHQWYGFAFRHDALNESILAVAH